MAGTEVGSGVPQPGSDGRGSSGRSVGRVPRILLGTPVAAALHGCHSGV